MNKKGISIVIGYVLLIAVSIVMSILVYQWLKTYVPSETLECPEGTSVFIKETNYDCINKILTIKLQNNGKFSLAGYFIHVSTSPDTESLATINIFSKITEGGTPHGNSIVYDLSINSLTPDSPNNVQTSSFDVLGYDTLTEVEIIPTRFQQEDNKNRYLSCSNEKVRETLKC
jgi:hypothetical protein